MLKKLTLLAMSVGALLAFAAPPAQATGPLITNALGEAAKTIATTSTNTLTHTAVGTFECTTSNLNITITANANTTAEGSGTGSAEGTKPVITHFGHCGSNSGLVVEFTAISVTDFHLTKHGTETTGTISLFFTFDLRSATGAGLIAECTLGGTLPIKKTGANTISFESKIAKTAGSAFCPTEATHTGSFTVNADGLGPATIH